ncbi:MAG: hypothetical protein P8K10_07100 [Crocinitomicaceae bacterium]|nr:hypothetical protein [Crocinitomicaceae bacterium]
MRFYLSLFFCFFFISYSFQQCERVLLKGKLVDSLRPQSFYNLMVVNRTTGKGVFGQPNGNFSAYVSNGDEIVLSIKGYPKFNYTIIADSNCQFLVFENIERLPQELDEVVIRPLKTLNQIKEERAELAMRDTRMVSGISAFESPITALYQAFSKKEKNKRWIAEQEYKDDQNRIVKELLALYVAYDIIELDTDEFDSFMSFLNINENFLKTASEMELVLFVKDKYEHFLMLR